MKRSLDIVRLHCSSGSCESRWLLNPDSFRKKLPDESVSLVLENPDLLDRAERREGLLHELFRESVGQSPAVDGAVSGTALVVDLVERQRLRVC